MSGHSKVSNRLLSKVNDVMACEVTQASDGPVDATESLMGTGLARLKQQGLTEGHATRLLTKYFKISDDRGKDIIIKAYGPNNCTTVHSDYLTEHESTDNRIVGKGIKQGLVLVAGYGYYPTLGPYVKDQGKYFYNTWRKPNDLFSREQFEGYVNHGYEAYFSSVEKSLYECMKPDVWRAIEQLWFPDKPDEARIFTDWLSVMIELPHLKITWAPILRSQQGVGKGILLEHVIRRILGDHAVKEMNFSRLTGQFSGDQLLSRLVVLNEVRAKTAANYNNLKDKITDPWHYVERKGEQAVTMRTSFCTLLFSNEPKPLSIAQDDRRYWLPDFITLPKEWGTGDHLQKNKQKVFTGLVDNLKNGGAKELAMFFKWNVYNQNDPATIYDEAPLSEAKDQIQSNRTEDASDRLIMYLQKIGDEEGFKISDLQKKFTPDLSDYDVMTICKKLGYSNNDNKKITVNNHRQRVWAKDHTKVNSLHVVN